jgi:hypothetical protein
MDQIPSSISARPMSCCSRALAMTTRRCFNPQPERPGIGDPLRQVVAAVLDRGQIRHKRDPYLTDTLAEFFEWVPVCPEVEVGMGTPREAIHLVQLSGEVRLVGRQSGADHTDAMRSYARRRVEQLASQNLSGYILKKDSPPSVSG